MATNKRAALRPPPRGYSDGPATAAPRKAALVFIFVTVVLAMLALGIIVPVLPKLVLGFYGGDTARAAAIYGIFGTVSRLCSSCFRRS